jgi:hypothetical protein
MTLATVGEDGPWAAAVFYAHDDCASISSPRRPRATRRTWRAEPRVAATIQRDYDDWPGIRGLQLVGTVREVAPKTRRACAPSTSALPAHRRRRRRAAQDPRSARQDPLVRIRAGGHLSHRQHAGLRPPRAPVVRSALRAAVTFMRRLPGCPGLSPPDGLAMRSPIRKATWPRPSSTRPALPRRRRSSAATATGPC